MLARIFAVGLLAVCSEPLVPALAEAPQAVSFSGGLCVVIGDVGPETIETLSGESWCVHVLCRNLEELSAVGEQVESWRQNDTTVAASLWDGQSLPLVDNLVSLVFCDASTQLSDAELLRVLRPAGRAVIGSPGQHRTLQKPPAANTDEWAHPWHGLSGNLATDDQQIDVPTGLQWIHGPLYPLAGRKTSTQSVVAAGGRLFAITQNVVENIGDPEPPYFLLARDAYNGMLLWQRGWNGPFTLGNGELNPRIVATADRVYLGWFDGVEILAAATGEPIAKLTTPGPVTKLLVTGERLFVQCDECLACYTLAQDEPQPVWEFTEGTSDGTVIDGDYVYTMRVNRNEEGVRVAELLCLQASSGSLVWRVDTNAWSDDRRLRICFAQDGYVALMAHGALHMLDGQSGKHLWSQTSDALPGKSYSDERYVGHVYRHGLVWMQLENAPREPEGQAVWAGFDPRTGEEKRRLRTVGPWPRTSSPAKMGCQLIAASDRHIMISRQATFVDFATGEKETFKFLRGGCGSGFVPANGLLYTSPHACGCYTEVVRGFLAAHSRPLPKKSPESEDRLTRFAEPPTPPQDHDGSAAGDWPMYRNTPARTAAAACEIPVELSQRWASTIIASTNEPLPRAWRIRSGMPLRIRP